MHDPLDLLAPPATLAPSEMLRQRLFDRTVREVHRQRRRRRLQGLATLAASFAAGFLTLAALLPPPAAPPPRQTAGPAAPVAPAVDLERQALDRPEKATELYRKAGDDYLRQGEHADALRCYGNALDEAAPRDLEVSADDSWLLIAIKHARKKEKEPCSEP
jgi:hypothetical protein